MKQNTLEFMVPVTKFAARAKKMAIEAEKHTGDNIYKVLIYFDKLYDAMNGQEKR